jgi:FkbM family methyltransferase
MIMARWVGATGKIYAFEPAPDSYAALEDHLKLNGLSERVVVLPIAISDTTGTSPFYVDGASGRNTLADSHDGIPTATAIQVDLTTVDAFCDGRKIVPHVLKIDVEGYELHALRGASNTLTRHKPLVLVEFHPMNWPAIGVTADDFRVFVKEVGYRIVPIDPERDPLTDYSHALLEYSEVQ